MGLLLIIISLKHQLEFSHKFKFSYLFEGAVGNLSANSIRKEVQGLNKLKLLEFFSNFSFNSHDHKTQSGFEKNSNRIESHYNFSINAKEQKHKFGSNKSSNVRDSLKNISLNALNHENKSEYNHKMNLSLIKSIKNYSLKLLNQKHKSMSIKSQSLIDFLKNFPFDSLTLELKETSSTSYYISHLINQLSAYIIKEPIIPINASCSQPPFVNPSKINCSLYPNAFTGRKRNSTARVAHLIQFGFDVDVLEIHLREIYDVVDYIFIIESTRSHLGFRRKWLMWENVRNQNRFALFTSKIVHLIIDDVDAISDGKSYSVFHMEFLQEHMRWEKFLKWNAITKYFKDDDLIGMGDTDEIPSRNNIHLLKDCEIAGPVDIGIWFPMGRITQAFKTHFPVPGNEYTLGDPTFWPLSYAKSYRKIPTRLRGKSGRYLLGGMHMTDHPYLPFLIVKSFTCSECADRSDRSALVKKIINFIKREDVYGMELFFGSLLYSVHVNRVTDIDNIKEKIKNVIVFPWFYECNRDRYGYWELKHDLRLD